MSNKEIISIKELTKKFGDFVAVDNISFSVNDGEIFAFLGPNGAGKTTTIKMLITLLEPTSGHGLIDNHDVVSDSAAVRRIIGYVPQMISVDGALTAYENLKLMAQLYDIPTREQDNRINEILKFFNLEKNANALVRTFSGGMIRKLEIGQAVLHRPKVLFLDEPTTGLDPIAKQNVWQHLLELNSKFGTTLFFSTHNMEEADEVCSRVAIINKGKLAALDTSAKLKKMTGKKKATLEDAFIFFTGNALQEQGNLRSIRDTRQIERRRG
jgi:ABC-2 type transport system ATP-binding protein